MCCSQASSAQHSSKQSQSSRISSPQQAGEHSPLCGWLLPPLDSKQLWRRIGERSRESSVAQMYSAQRVYSAWVSSADGRVSAQVLRGLRTLALDVCLSMDTDSLEHEQRLECWGDACTALHAWWVTAALDAGGKLLPCTHEHFSARSTPVIVCVGEHMEP